ncbi:winged helix-turn-helix domain-containing protein [Streptomyces sp. NPDC001774]
MLMLRMHFTTADLQRIRWAAQPEPLIETVFSLQLLQQPHAHSTAFSHWSAQTGRHMGRLGLSLFDLTTGDDGTLPELLIAPSGAASLSEGLEAVKSKPAAQALSDLAVTRSQRPDLPQWVVDFHHRRPEATRRLAQLLGKYYEVAIAPMWQHVESTVRASLDSAPAEAGMMLRGLHPSVSWDYPVLTLPCHIPHDVDVHLAGRGLLVVPAFFLRAPMARLDNHDEQAPVELYVPVDHHDAAPPADSQITKLGIARLLGRTRAEVLASLTSVRSTSDVAAVAGISAATASHHLNALRAGGLIATVREHGSARHSLTHLGLRLLTCSSATPDQPVTGTIPIAQLP